MKIVLASDGDPESYTAWSGITHSLVEHLRGAGHEVRGLNVSLHGMARAAAAALTISSPLERWRTRFTLGAAPFELRSAVARRLLANGERWADCGIQIGATFHAFRRARLPYFLCCDSNIKVAIAGQNTGFTHGSFLSQRELDAVISREAAVYRGAAGIFTLSERLRQSFITQFDIPAERVRAVLAGPNFDIAKIPPPHDREEERPPTILFVGAQFERKGGDVLVKAFRGVKRAVPDARLLLVGAERAPVSGAGIESLGYLDKTNPSAWAALVAAYRSADVFCLPTRFEPFGIAFVEAMHFGLPCIATRVNAVPEIVADGETGFLVDVDDAAALEQKLVYLLTDRQAARNFGAAGRERANRLFTWPAVVGRMTAAMIAAIEPASS